MGQLSGGQRVPTRSHLCSEKEPGGSKPVWCLVCDGKAVEFWSRSHPRRLPENHTALLARRPGSAVAKQGCGPDACCRSGARGHWELPWAPRHWQEPGQALTSSCWHGGNRTVSASSRQQLFFAGVFQPLPV